MSKEGKRLTRLEEAVFGTPDFDGEPPRGGFQEQIDWLKESKAPAFTVKCLYDRVWAGSGYVNKNALPVDPGIMARLEALENQLGFGDPEEVEEVTDHASGRLARPQNEPAPAGDQVTVNAQDAAAEVKRLKDELNNVRWSYGIQVTALQAQISQLTEDLVREQRRNG